jgi:hypothetical protein
VLLGFTGYQALQARDALEIVAAKFEDIAEQLKEGDEAGARESVAGAQAAAADARDNTEGPGWWLAERLPEVGDDVRAVRTVADVTDVLASQVLPDVVAASETLDPASLRPKNGRIRLKPIRAVAPAVTSANELLHAQKARIEEIETSRLVSPIGGPVETLARELRDAAELSTKASQAVRLLPLMLGSTEARTYLVLFQNNAEIRATGGIPGAVAVITAENGKVEIVKQGAAGDLGTYDRPVRALTAEETALYESKLGIFPADITFTPDFPRTAELARAMWQRSHGATVDGVLSTDPVALSNFLAATGPVELPGGQALAAESAVQLLLNEVYLTQLDNDLQNSFFAAAAAAVFEELAAGRAQPGPLMDALSKAASESRLLVWSAHAEEQRVLDDTVLSGRVPRLPAARPFVGVFFNGGTASKMQYYLDYAVDVQPVACNIENRQQLDVRVTMTSNAPAEGKGLTVFVTGPGQSVSPGTMRVNAHLYAPTGGWIADSAVDGEARPLNELEHHGHPVGSRTVDLAPGETRVLTYTVMTGLDQPGDVRLRVTPGVHGPGVGAVAPSACGVA